MSTVYVWIVMISTIVNSQPSTFVRKSGNSTTCSDTILFNFTPKIPWPHMQSGGHKCNKYCVLNYHTTVYNMKLRWQRDVISNNSFLQCIQTELARNIHYIVEVYSAQWTPEHTVHGHVSIQKLSYYSVNTNVWNSGDKEMLFKVIKGFHRNQKDAGMAVVSKVHIQVWIPLQL